MGEFLNTQNSKNFLSMTLNPETIKEKTDHFSCHTHGKLLRGKTQLTKVKGQACYVFTNLIPN